MKNDMINAIQLNYFNSLALKNATPENNFENDSELTMNPDFIEIVVEDLAKENFTDQEINSIIEEDGLSRDTLYHFIAYALTFYNEDQGLARTVNEVRQEIENAELPIDEFTLEDIEEIAKWNARLAA